MEILPNTGKNLIIEVDGRRFTRYPIRTKLITSEDSDIVEIVQEYAGKYVESGDIVFISEKAVAITQGRSYPLEKVKASWLAQFLSRFVMKTPVGIGLGSPQTMQLAIEEVGVARILTAAIIGALGKIVGIRGIFYMIAGHGARSIDGAVPYAIPPYNTYVSKGPLNASEVSEKTRVLILEKISTRMSTQDLSALVSKKKDIGVAIVDANDIGVNILGASKGVDKKLVAKIIKDNPLGQSDEQTPIGIIREIPIINTGLRKAELSDIQNLSTITTPLFSIKKYSPCLICFFMNFSSSHKKWGILICNSLVIVERFCISDNSAFRRPVFIIGISRIIPIGVCSSDCPKGLSLIIFATNFLSTPLLAPKIFTPISLASTMATPMSFFFETRALK